jgi:glycosyltransferase involved in cell wall biosynthesis
MKKDKLNIAIHFPYTPKYVADFINAIENYGKHDYVILTDTRASEGLTYDETLNASEVIQTPIIKIKGLWYSAGLVKHLIFQKPDIFIVNGNPRDFGSLLVMLVGFFTRTKVIAWGMWHRIGKPKLYTVFYFWLCGVICTANFSYARVGKISQVARGIRPAKVHVIGTAISDASGSHINNAKMNSHMLSDCGLEQDFLSQRFTLLQVMRLTSIKKPNLLIELMIKLRENGNNSVLLLAGGGPLESDFKRKVDFHSLGKSIYMLGPVYDQDKLAALYNAADITVVPTCIGLTAHQSLSFNVPVITDDSIIHQASEFEILTDGYNARIYKEGNINELAAIIEDLSNDPLLLEALKKNCRASLSKYSMENKVANFIRAIEIV